MMAGAQNDGRENPAIHSTSWPICLMTSQTSKRLTSLCRPLINPCSAPSAALLPDVFDFVHVEGSLRPPFHSQSQRIFFIFLRSHWHSSDAESNSHSPSNSLISSVLNQDVWCKPAALRLWLISSPCAWMFALIECTHFCLYIRGALSAPVRRCL